MQDKGHRLNRRFEYLLTLFYALAVRISEPDICMWRPHSLMMRNDRA